MSHNKMEEKRRKSLGYVPKQKSMSAAARKAAATAALRAQLHQELENKKPCNYQPHECTQLTLDGYDYCLRHIMEDKNAPYKQCSYVYNGNGKRCHLPAPKGDKKDYGYCHEHALKSHLLRVRMGSKHQPATSAETLLSSLSHYVTSDRSRANSSTVEPMDDDPTDSDTDDKSTKSLDPFSEINATEVNASCSDILDYASESESDVEPATNQTVWQDSQADSSEDDSIDSEQEDILKHAGVYTAEEITLVTRDKLIRLQSLYIEQFKHLQHVLKEKRRKYLLALKKEKETYCSIHDQPKDTTKEQKLYNKLKALNRYQKKNGIDAIMSKKCTELRAKLTEGMNPKPQNYTKCSFTEGGVKCIEKSMPVSKYCKKHILSDPSQVLFKRCSRVQADIECNEPILSIFKDATCRFHMDFPSARNYSDRVKDSDSDVEDSSDTTQPTDLLSQMNTPHSAMDLDIKQDIVSDYSLDMLPHTTSSDSPQISTSSINFANQFPTQNEDTLTNMKEFLQDPAFLENVPQLENVKSDIETGEEKIEIDPDDDMAGLLMEMQKEQTK